MKASQFFSTKHIGLFEILNFEILTKHQLMMSLVLNNRAQVIQNIIRLTNVLVSVFLNLLVRSL